MAVTMRDIARMADVSRPVVCSVLGGKSTCRVSEEKRKLILELVEKYGYQPNLQARSLRSGKTKTVGLLFPSFRDRIIGDIMSELYRCLRAAGYTALISVWESLDELEAAYKGIMGKKIDGLITCDYRKDLNVENIPAVVYGNAIDDVDCIAIDYHTAFREAAEYLYGLGHRRIGYIGADGIRYQNFHSEFSRNPEFDLSAVALNGGFSENGITGIHNLLDGQGNKPTAILCHNDAVALAAMAEAQRMGYTIGKDLSIIGLDNTREAAISYPSLTTIDTFIVKKAGIMTDMLLARLNDPQKKYETVTLESKLILRESCGPCKKQTKRKK